MENAFIWKKQSTIMLALLLIIGLYAPASSLAVTPGEGIMNNVPVLAHDLTDINVGGGIAGQYLSMPLDLAVPGGSLIAFQNATRPSSADKNRSANATNKSTTANATKTGATNQSASIKNPAGDSLTYADFNFKATPEQISNMSLLDRMWRNAHLGSMGRAYEGITAYPEWILPTEFTKSAITMADQFAISDVSLNMTMPGTHLMTRLWPTGISGPNIMDPVIIGPQKQSNLSNNASANMGKTVPKKAIKLDQIIDVKW